MIKLIRRPNYQYKLISFKLGGSIKKYRGGGKNTKYEYDPAIISDLNSRLSFIESPKQRAVVIANILKESGGDPMALSESGKYMGLLQWDASRINDSWSRSYTRDQAMEKQIQLIKDTLNRTNDGLTWMFGGSAYGYNRKTRKAYDVFMNPDSTLEQVSDAFVNGFIRPGNRKGEVAIRTKIAQNVFNIIGGEETTTAPTTPTRTISNPFPKQQYVAEPDALINRKNIMINR